MVRGFAVSGGAGSGGPDRRVALTRVAFVLSAFALLATTAPPPPPRYHFVFSKTLAGPSVELTSAAPRATFLVTARATGLGPGLAPTTENAAVQVEGVITAAGVAPSGTLVNVSAHNGAAAGDGLNVATSFTVAHQLGFNGNCSVPTDCETTFLVDLSRTDGGESGGTVSVDWSLTFSSSIEKPEAPDEERELPWTAEVTQQ